MAPLTLHGSLLVAWTDPMVLGVAAIGVALIAAVAVLGRNRSQGSSTPAQPGGQPATSGGQQTGLDAPGNAQAEPETGASGPADSENLARGKGRSLAELAAHEEIDDTELISRFVLDASGDRVGETMTITDGEVILKRDGEFFSVPPDAIIEKNGTLLADANIDWDRAREAGEAWQDENLDRMEYDETGMPTQT